MPDADRRHQDRQPHATPAVIACPTPRPRPRELPPEAQYCPHDSRAALSVNVTRRGVCLRSESPLPVGTYQTLRLDGEPRPREVRVLRCDPREAGYEIGAVFC